MKKTNLLYIFADQWRRHGLGFMNIDPVSTPNIDRFAEESVVFDNAVSCFPLCTPHRGAILSGRYPLTLGLDTNCKPGNNVFLKENEICIGEALKEYGYQTGYIGKWHLDKPEMEYKDSPESGAKGWDAYTPPGKKRHGFDFWYSYGAWDNHLKPHYWQNSHDMIQIDQWSVEHETDVAIDFIKKRKKDNPFALYISWNPPHTPFEEVPERYKKLYENKKLKANVNVQSNKLTNEKDVSAYNKRFDYFAQITGIDEQFKRLMNFLEEENLDKDTIVVLSSDHGEMLGAHGCMGKHTWYEESIGIPMLIRWKETLLPKRDMTVINSVDHMPTLLGLMNIPKPNTVEGTDLSNVVKGIESNLQNEAFIAAYTGVEKEKRLGIPSNTSGWRAVRTPEYTFVIDKGYEPNYVEKKYLYDLKKDPFQLQPVVIKDNLKNKTAKKLEKSLEEWLQNIKDPFLQKKERNDEKKL